MPQLWVLVSVSMFCFLSASSGRTASSEFFQRDYTELYQAPGRWSQINGIYIYVYIHKYTYIYIYHRWSCARLAREWSQVFGWTESWCVGTQSLQRCAGGRARDPKENIFRSTFSRFNFADAHLLWKTCCHKMGPRGCATFNLPESFGSSRVHNFPFCHRPCKVMARRILIAFEGSRGDIQPYIVAALALSKSGYDVMAAGPSDGQALAEEFQVPFTPFRPNSQLLTTDPEVTKAIATNSLMKLVRAANKADKRLNPPEVKAKAIESLYTLMVDWKPHLVLVSTLTLPLALMIARKVPVPVICLSLQNARPSKTLKVYGFPTVPPCLRRPAWRLVMSSVLQVLFKDSAPTLEKIMGIPASQLRVPTSEHNHYHDAKCKFLSIIATSAAVCGELPSECNSMNVQIGALMPSLDQTGSSFGGEQLKQMNDFLAAGSAPVYIGFGSIICGTSKFMCLLSLRALRIVGERGIVVSSWSTMSEQDIEGEPDRDELKAFCAENVLFLKTAPHGQLFPQCKVIVHHGGAGTFNASARSGTPTVICPIFMDQLDHRRWLNRRGFGVGLKQMSKLQPQDLADAIRKCINTPSIQEKAQEVARIMEQEDGPRRLVEVVNDYMDQYIETGRHMELKRKLDEKQPHGCLAPSGGKWLEWWLPCAFKCRVVEPCHMCALKLRMHLIV